MISKEGGLCDFSSGFIGRSPWREWNDTHRPHPFLTSVSYRAPLSAFRGVRYTTIAVSFTPGTAFKRTRVVLQTHARRPRLLLRTGDAIGGLIILLAGFLLGLGCGLSASKRQRDERCPRWAYSPLRWPITA